MTRHVFEITFETAAARTGKVLMDGVELRGVTAIDLGAHVNGHVELTLRFLPEKVLARMVDPKVLTLIQTLKAETTSLGDVNKTYCLAEPAASRVEE